MPGIDVSKFQGDPALGRGIDWARVAADRQDFQFVFIRAADGVPRAGTTHGVDPTFAYNWEGAKQNGLLRGAYQFFRLGEDPVAQADLLLRALGILDEAGNVVGELDENDLPPVIDVEAASATNPVNSDASTYAGLIQQWIDRVESVAKRRPIVYAARIFWNDSVRSTAFADYPLWAPHFGANCPNLAEAWPRWTIWQTSQTGRVDGIIGDGNNDGAVDLDLFDGTIDELLETGKTVPRCGDEICSGAETPDTCLADCPPSCPVPPGGRIADESDPACFVMGGPAAAISRITGAGYGDTLLTVNTRTSTTEASHGRWNLYFATPGVYRIEVHLAPGVAQSRQAKYLVHHAGSEEAVIVDQSAASGWTTLGEFRFARGGTQWIHLGDATGEAALKLVFDAIKITAREVPVPAASIATGLPR